MFLGPFCIAKSQPMFHDLDSSLKGDTVAFVHEVWDLLFDKQRSISSRSWLCFCKIRSTRSPSKQRASYSDLTSTLVLSSALSATLIVWSYTSPTEGNVILERGCFVRLGAWIIPSSVLGFLSYHSPCQSFSTKSVSELLPSTPML